MANHDAQRSKYQEGLRLAEAGCPEEALATIREHLLRCPRDGEALNDAGALLYGLGRLDEAARHLRLALTQLKDDPARTLENLAEVCLADGRAAEAAALFGPLAEAGALRGELIHRTAAAMLQQNDCAGAVEALLRAMRLPGQAGLIQPILEKVRKLRPKVGLVFRPRQGGLPEQLGPFLQERFETKTFRGRDRADLAAFLQWCDVAWFEGCGAEAVVATGRPKTCRLIVHVHPHEAYQPALEQVTWTNVDLLVTQASRPVRDFLAGRLADLARAARIEPLPRGVDLGRWPMPQRPRGKNLACTGGLALRRNPMFLLQCFRRLLQADGQYRLFFAGYFQDDSLEAYVRHLLGELGLAEAVRFDGWQEDLPGWLADKHYIVSADIVEGGTGVLEAMAMGLKPVVHAFPAAGELYPPEWLYRTDEEFCRRVLEDDYRPPAYRQFVEENFPIDRTLARVNELLAAMERDQPRASGSGPTPTGEAQAAAGVFEAVRQATDAMNGGDR